MKLKTKIAVTTIIVTLVVVPLIAIIVHVISDEFQERRAILSTICQDNRMSLIHIGSGKFCVDDEGRLYSRSKLVDNKY
jgi:hypothetical protein|tara:strand:+ start:132 stop:368 length:237 start_codon:yes stop_codon:yes gene_type:complete